MKMLPNKQALCIALEKLRAEGLCPLEADGRLAGNGAFALTEEEQAGMDACVVVSPSGRDAKALAPEDLIEIVNFSVQEWSATYRSRADDLHPTSDLALYWSVFMKNGPSGGVGPPIALHAHALATDADATACSIPISRTETPFGTREDYYALRELLEQHPYPTHDAWIRRNHGVFVVAKTFDAAESRLLSLARRGTPETHVR